MKSVALIVEDPPEGIFWVGSDLIEYDESGMARRRAISVIISIALLDLQHENTSGENRTRIIRFTDIDSYWLYCPREMNESI